MKYKLFSSFLLLSLIVSCGRPSANIVQIKGSDTEVNLALDLAERFMQQDSAASISVTGGGSGVGIAAIINGKTDIANASRSMKQEEIDQAKANGVNPCPIIFGVDGLAVIVNAENPVDTINFESLSKIFSGKANNWQEFGGKDLPLSTYGRQSNSGTHVFFRDFVVKADYAQSVKAMNGNAQIVEGIKTDKSGIGYVGIAYVVDKNGKVADGIKILKVSKGDGIEASMPNKLENITSGKYPLTRPLFQITNGTPKGMALKFIQFELSPEGQQMVLDGGYYPITDEQREYDRKLGVIP